MHPELKVIILKTFRVFESVIERRQKNSQHLLDHNSIKHQEIWLYCMLLPTDKSNLWAGNKF